MLLQKFCAESFSFTTKVTAHLKATGERVGVIVVGQTYSLLAVVRKTGGLYLTNSATESSSDIKLADSTLFLRIGVSGPSASCKFEYSIDGNRYRQVGSLFPATAAKWIGAKIGLFASRPSGTTSTGYADFAWVNVDKYGSYITGVAPDAEGNSVNSTVHAIPVHGSISFGLPAPAMLTLTLYTASGARVREIQHRGAAGRNRIIMNRGDFAAGVYLYEIRAGTERIGKGVIAFSKVDR